MELDLLVDNFANAYYLVSIDKPARARMCINGALTLIRPIKNSYPETNLMFVQTCMVNRSLKYDWCRMNTKEWAMIQLDHMIRDVEAWMDCRRVA